MKHPFGGCLLGVLLLALATAAAGEPAKAKPARKHVESHVQTHVETHVQTHAQSRVSHVQSRVVSAAPEPPPPPPPDALPSVSKRYKYQSPFEMEYGAHLASTTGMTPGVLQGDDDPREGAPNGPRTPGAQVDSAGVPYQALHPQTPPLVTMGDWDFSADAHLPLTHTHDTGAAISAKHGF